VHLKYQEFNYYIKKEKYYQITHTVGDFRFGLPSTNQLTGKIKNKLLFKEGVPNSVAYAGQIVTKNQLACRIKRKNVTTGHNRRLKVP
jgi:hypothetical protein